MLTMPFVQALDLPGAKGPEAIRSKRMPPPPGRSDGADIRSPH